jgi:Ca2+-binding RTX toxin-like protein
LRNSIGGSGADSLAGNGASNTLTGGAGDDTLSGGAGSDLLFGGLNNDTYLFTTASATEADQVTENTNEGTDTLNFAALTTSVVLNLGLTTDSDGPHESYVAAKLYQHISKMPSVVRAAIR